MPTNFSSHDIFFMAIQIEQKGQSFYDAMAMHSQNEILQAGFEWLAKEEQLHLDKFEQLRDSIEKINTKNIDNWDEVSLYFNALLDTKVFPESSNGNSLAQELDDEIGAIQISISFEKDTILFLQELSRWIDPEDQKKIEKLIEKEKSHILKLLEMKKHAL